MYFRLGSGAELQLNDFAGSKDAPPAVYPHPAAEAEAKFGPEAQYSQRMRSLAATQGIHAPLRLAMERKIMRRLTPHQPSLYSNHVMAAQLEGTLDSIDFCDILNSEFIFLICLFFGLVPSKRSSCVM